MESPLREFSLEGRKLIVTGASSGIGRAVVLLCAELGGTLILNGRDQGRLEDNIQYRIAQKCHKESYAQNTDELQHHLDLQDRLSLG